MGTNIQIYGTSATSIVGDGIITYINVTNRTIIPNLLTVKKGNVTLEEGTAYEVIGSDIQFYSPLISGEVYYFSLANVTTARIQVRRGELEDLPVLAEGELGYAIDGYRLFIGNAPVEFTGDGQTTEFVIEDRTIISSHLNVLVDGTPFYPGVEYRLDGTKLIFTEAPSEGYSIIVGFNTEITTQKHLMDTLKVSLSSNSTYEDVGLNFNLNNYNTAVIEYSIKTTSNSMRIGTLRIISDGESSSYVDDISSGIGQVNTQFMTRIDSGRLYLTHNSTEPANFYYSIKLWNTI